MHTLKQYEPYVVWYTAVPVLALIVWLLLQVSDTIVRQISHLDESGCWNCSSPDNAGAMLFMLGTRADDNI